jgi:hypothetical protein
MGTSRYRKPSAGQASKGAADPAPASAKAPNPLHASWVDYKAHPIFVGAAAVVATAVFFLQIVLPIMTARVNNQAADLETKVEQLKSQQTTFDGRASETKQALLSAKHDVLVARQERDQALEKLKALQLKDSFSGDDIYPAGWRKVRIGDTQALLEDSFPNVEKKSRSFWSVIDDTQPLFTDATYYFDLLDKTKNQQITHILMFFARDSGQATTATAHNVAVQLLSERFGSPKETVDEDSGAKQLVWMEHTYKITVNEANLHIEPTCATTKIFKARIVNSEQIDLCSQ